MMESFYSLPFANQYNENEEQGLYPFQSYNDNVDELLKSPLLNSSKSTEFTPRSSLFLFDYKDLYDMNNETNDDLNYIADHTAEMNYKAWLNSNMLNS